MNAKKKLKREDFIFENGWFETKVKKPKELQMQQFQISDCEQCNIFLFDSNACVYIDSCKYCNIFIGPSQSSIFVRDCQSINLVSISQQFRVRDSFNCKFAIFCQSQPIIESSNNLTFSCYPNQYCYKQLQNQMREVKLNQWNNNWFDVYDFTPSKFNSINFKLSSYQKDFIKFKELFMKEVACNEIEKIQFGLIPAVQGKNNIETCRLYELDQVIFLVIYPLINARMIQSLVLQSKYLVAPSEIHKILSDCDQRMKKQKILFLKIRNSEESRWKKCDKVLKIIKSESQKELIESIIFAPFKDQH